MDSVYIGGVAITKFGKSTKTLMELLCDAATETLSSPEVQEVDAIYLGVMNPEEFTGDSNVAAMKAQAKREQIA